MVEAFSCASKLIGLRLHIPACYCHAVVFQSCSCFRANVCEGHWRRGTLFVCGWEDHDKGGRVMAQGARVMVSKGVGVLAGLDRGPKVRKTSRRDLAFVMSMKLNGATTVSATMLLAARAGISIFVTGGTLPSSLLLVPGAWCLVPTGRTHNVCMDVGQLDLLSVAFVRWYTEGGFLLE